MNDVPYYSYIIEDDVKLIQFNFNFDLNDIGRKAQLRSILSESQNHRCCWCGIRTVDEENHYNSATLEHILPKSKNGKSHPDNYVMSCHACNMKRGTMTVEEFMTIVSKYNDIIDCFDKGRLRGELRSKGIIYKSNSKPRILRKKLRHHIVIECIKDGKSKIFPENSKEYLLYNRLIESENLDKIIGEIE